MRTTIRLDDDLLREAKAAAAERGTTLTALFEEALREMLIRARATPDRSPALALPTFSGRGPQPGVDLHDTAALVGRMDDAGP